MLQLKGTPPRCILPSICQVAHLPAHQVCHAEIEAIVFLHQAGTRLLYCKQTIIEEILHIFILTAHYVWVPALHVRAGWVQDEQQKEQHSSYICGLLPNAGWWKK